MRSSVLVGAVLLVAVITLTWFVSTTSKDQFDEDSTYELLADFTDAAGIRWKTRVQINGIDVGKIDHISHARRRDGRLMARVNVRLLKEYETYANARLRKVAESLLGDFRLDLDPGARYDWCEAGAGCQIGFTCTSDGQCLRACSADADCLSEQTCEQSTCEYRRLGPGSVIGNVESLSDLDEIQSQLRNVAQNVNDVTESFSKVLAGPEGEGSLKSILASVERSMGAIEVATSALGDTMSQNDEQIDGIIRNLHAVTRALAHSTAPDGDIQRVTENLAQITDRLAKLTNAVSTMVAGDVTTGEDGPLGRTLENLNDSISHLTAISRKIDEGQGTLGRVVNDPGIAEKLEQTIDDTSELIGGLSRLDTQIELRSQYEVPFANKNKAEVGTAMKNALALRLVPKPDKYYMFEAVADPRGNSSRTITTTTTSDANGQTNVTREENVIAFDDLKFSAQFAKRYYFMTMRFGIIESTGGLGLNLHGLEDALELRLDLFDFNRRKTTAPEKERLPRLRATFLYEFYAHLHVQGGVDDPFNDDLSTWFFGGALRFSDDDLKALLTVAPTP